MLSIGRLESIKRPDLAVKAMSHVDSSIRLMMAGDGTARRSTEALAESLGLGIACGFWDRRRSAGARALQGRAGGRVPAVRRRLRLRHACEAFLARKPVITVNDAGGPLEFVEDGLNGFVCDPEPDAIASAMNRLAANRALAASLGDTGYERARTVTWDGVIAKLVE